MATKTSMSVNPAAELVDAKRVLQEEKPLPLAPSPWSSPTRGGEKSCAAGKPCFVLLSDMGNFFMFTALRFWF